MTARLILIGVLAATAAGCRNACGDRSVSRDQCDTPPPPERRNASPACDVCGPGGVAAAPPTVRGANAIPVTYNPTPPSYALGPAVPYAPTVPFGGFGSPPAGPPNELPPPLENIPSTTLPVAKNNVLPLPVPVPNPTPVGLGK